MKRGFQGGTNTDHNQIFFEGAPYLSAGEIAAAHGYVRDYVARLCRNGRVVGKQIGRNWYVDERAFKEFFIKRQHALARRREGLANERRRDYQTAQKAGLSAQPRPRASYIRSMQMALAAQDARALDRVSQFVSAPTGVSEAALRAAHVPLYAISPWMEFVHKVIALTLAIMLVFVAYSMVDPQFARFAANSITDDVSALARSSDSAFSLAATARAQFAAAGENPIVVFVLLWDGTENLARSPALIGSASDGSVNVSVQPYARPQLSSPAPISLGGLSSPALATQPH